MEVFMTLTTLKVLKRLPWKIMTVMEATIGFVLMVSDSCDNKLYCERLAARLNTSKQQRRFCYPSLAPGEGPITVCCCQVTRLPCNCYIFRLSRLSHFCFAVTFAKNSRSNFHLVICVLVRVKRRLQTRGKTQTEGKNMQTADCNPGGKMKY